MQQNLSWFYGSYLSLVANRLNMEGETGIHLLIYSFAHLLILYHKRRFLRVVYPAHVHFAVAVCEKRVGIVYTVIQPPVSGPGKFIRSFHIKCLKYFSFCIQLYAFAFVLKQEILASPFTAVNLPAIHFFFYRGNEKLDRAYIASGI